MNNTTTHKLNTTRGTMIARYAVAHDGVRTGTAVNSGQIATGVWRAFRTDGTELPVRFANLSDAADALR